MAIACQVVSAFIWFRQQAEAYTVFVSTGNPKPLSDTDYEFLYTQLLEGVTHGWQQPRVLRFFESLGDRGSQAEWVGWLRRFGDRLLASPVPNNELAARMVQLGQMGCGEISDVSYEIGMQLLTRSPTRTGQREPVLSLSLRYSSTRSTSALKKFRQKITSKRKTQNSRQSLWMSCL
jgi:hypothetical protein